MERKGYNIWDLEIITIKETQRFDNLQDESSEEVIKFIKDTILNERLERLEAFLGKEMHITYLSMRKSLALQ